MAKMDPTLQNQDDMATDFLSFLAQRPGQAPGGGGGEPPPPESGGGPTSGVDSRGSQTPADRAAGQEPTRGANPDFPTLSPTGSPQPKTLTPPSPEASFPNFGGEAPKGAQAGASEPMSPSPVSMEPPKPFSPLKSPSPNDLVTPHLDMGGGGTQFSTLGKGSLLGSSSGGLTGGGLSSPGQLGEGGDNSLLLLLSKLLGGGA